VRDKRVYLRHILACITDIEAFTAPGRDQFENSRLHQAAVLRTLQVLAESALQLSEADHDRFPDVEWRSIRNFRNRLVHEYLELDPELIWFTLEQSLPPLKHAAEILLSEADAAAR
jgi:uncharacterized protein with HEPN domain